MPGTALKIGVREPAGGAITSRSVCGVKAKGGSPGSELLAGVVTGLLVVRSGLSKQTASAMLAPRSVNKRLHRVAGAEADALAKHKATTAAAAAAAHRFKPCMSFLPVRATPWMLE